MPSCRTPDGRALSYRLVGAGPLLVCHPGGPGVSGDYLGDLGGLAERRTLVLLDPMGTGRSDAPLAAGAYALTDYVAGLEVLRRHLAIESLDLLGHSHGSFVALGYAIAHPARVRRLVLVATAARLDEASLQAAEAAAQARAGEPWFDDAWAALLAEPDDETTDAEAGALLARALPFYFGRFDERAAAFRDRALRDPVNVAAYQHWRDVDLPALDFRPDLPAVTAATLVVAGERDFILGPAGCAEVVAHVPGSELLVLPGVGHFPWIEAPEAFAGAVVRFLDAR
jgi:pimeloyl-ACP methyl ester carboxylesterase